MATAESTPLDSLTIGREDKIRWFRDPTWLSSALEPHKKPARHDRRRSTIINDDLSTPPGALMKPRVSADWSRWSR
jgi:hypothetical protein